MSWKNSVFIALCLLTVSASSFADTASLQTKDTIVLPGFPVIGKWMIDQDGEIAHWLTEIYQGKKLAEPINIIIRINRSTEDEAKLALMNATHAAGFTLRKGHTSGYRAILGDGLMAQFPNTPNHAFSNIGYIFPNHHGRIFGPLAYDGKFYFIGAFSREGVDWIGKLFRHSLLHRYDSFMRARDRFVEKMCEDGGAVNSGTVNMENALPLTDSRTSGDHDGTATVLDLN